MAGHGECQIKENKRVRCEGVRLTRHSVTVEVVSDGLLQFVVRRGLLEPLAQILLEVLVQLVSCHCGHK